MIFFFAFCIRIFHFMEILSVLLVVGSIPSQLHAVSSTQQGRQKEPYIKTLRSPLSPEFWRRYVLSGRT